MPTLTPAELADFRMTVGDDELQPDGDYIVGDTEAQALYDKAGANFALTCVFWLRRVVGYCRKFVDEQQVQAGSNSRYGTLFTQSKEWLEYWTEQYRSNSGTGLGEGTTVDGDVNTDTSSPEGLGFLDLQTTTDYAEADRAAAWYS